MQMLEFYALPILGGGAIDRISPADGMAVPTSIWGTQPEAAQRDRQRIHAVLRWSSAHGLVTEHLAGEAIDGALPPMPAVKSHLRALPCPEVVSSRPTHDQTCWKGAVALCAPGPISWHRATPEPQQQRRAMLWIQAHQKHALSMCDRLRIAKSAHSDPDPGRITPIEALEQ